MPPQNFFDQFDSPTPSQTAKRASEQRAQSEEGRAQSREQRASAEEARKQAEFEEKHKSVEAPGDLTKTGDEYLQTLKPNLAAQVRALAEGRRAFPSAYALKSPQSQILVAAATQYDPTLDAANAATRVATRKDFTSGKAAQNMTSINTAIGHLVTLRKAAQGLDNRALRAWNALANRALTETGDPAVRNFQIARQAVASELTRAFRGTGGSLTEVKDWEAAINAADSPAQLDKAIGQATELLTSRLESMQSQYQQGMGRSGDAMQFLTPKNQKSLESLLVGGGVETPAAETADVLQGAPAGSAISPEDVAGWRYTPENEARILDQLRAPDATPEAVAAAVADAAVEEGHIPPEQREDYYQNSLGVYGPFLQSASPEQRANIKALDYGEIDKAATERAGLGASVAQTLRNVPESAAQLAQGLVALPGSAIASAVTGKPQGATAGLMQLAGEMGEGPATEALKSSLAERYGNLKRTAIRDPLGLAADVSLPLTLGGTALARAPGMVGRAGEMANIAGRFIDPLSGTVALATEGLPAALRNLRANYPAAGQSLARVPSELAGLPSGAGGPAIREAFGAGMERGVRGAPTPRSEALTGAMRRPEDTGDDLVSAARGAVQNLREAASAQYQTAMSRFGGQQTLIPMNTVITRMHTLKPRNFDAMVDAPNRPSNHLAWQNMMTTVEDYAAKAAQDPTLLHPLAMDAFKQDLYDIGSKVGGAYDRDAARIAGAAYNAVRSELVRHDPVYANIMRDYERAAREAQQLEGTFGLAAARGKQPNIDSASRRLLSIMRNNAHTNYGQRATQGRRLADLDTSGTLMPTLAGQTLSAIPPRGLQGLGATTAAVTTALTNPSMLPAFVGFSPRVAGEAAYGLGRVAGTGRRAATTLRDVAAPMTDTISDLYNRYPTAALAVSQGSNRLEDVDQDLRAKYGLDEGYAPTAGY